MGRAVVALVSYGLAGCSFAFVNTAPPAAPPDAECTESAIAPIMDGVVAAGFGVASVAAFVSHSSSCNPNDNNSDFCVSGNFGGLVGVALAVPTVLYAISAIHGASSVGECRRLHSRRPATPPKPWNPDE